jgi:hypothetical protein
MTSYCLDTIILCLHRRGKISDYAYLDWATNSTLQLHRMVHESAGSGTWYGSTSFVPVTIPGQKLLILDLAESGKTCFRNASHETFIKRQESSYTEKL